MQTNETVDATDEQIAAWLAGEMGDTLGDMWAQFHIMALYALIEIAPLS